MKATRRIQISLRAILGGVTFLALGCAAWQILHVRVVRHDQALAYFGPGVCASPAQLSYARKLWFITQDHGLWTVPYEDAFAPSPNFLLYDSGVGGNQRYQLRVGESLLKPLRRRATLERLCHVQQLRRLFLEGDLSHAGYANPEGLLSAADADALARLSGLAWLGLLDLYIPSCHFKNFASRHTLEKLTLCDPRYTESDLQEIIKQLPRLKELHYCGGIDLEKTLKIADSSKLIYLNITFKDRLTHLRHPPSFLFDHEPIPVGNTSHLVIGTHTLRTHHSPDAPRLNIDFSNARSRPYIVPQSDHFRVIAVACENESVPIVDILPGENLEAILTTNCGIRLPKGKQVPIQRIASNFHTPYLTCQQGDNATFSLQRIFGDGSASSFHLTLATQDDNACPRFRFNPQTSELTLYAPTMLIPYKRGTWRSQRPLVFEVTRSTAKLMPGTTIPRDQFTFQLYTLPEDVADVAFPYQLETVSESSIP